MRLINEIDEHTRPSPQVAGPSRTLILDLLAEGRGMLSPGAGEDVEETRRARPRLRRTLTTSSRRAMLLHAARGHGTRRHRPPPADVPGRSALGARMREGLGSGQADPGLGGRMAADRSPQLVLPSRFLLGLAIRLASPGRVRAACSFPSWPTSSSVPTGPRARTPASRVSLKWILTLGGTLGLEDGKHLCRPPALDACVTSDGERSFTQRLFARVALGHGP